MKNKLLRLLIMLLAVIISFSAIACGDYTPPTTPPGQQGVGNGGGESNPPIYTPPENLDSYDYATMNLVGQDGVGRKVTVAHDYDYNTDVKMGIFYSVWHGGDSNTNGSSDRDIQKYIDNNWEYAILDPNTNLNQFHYCGEPLFGYYHSEDKWVIMRHMELLTQAGIDFLCIDSTNGVIYQQATLNLLDTLLELKEEGYPVPKVCFYTNEKSGETVSAIRTNFYSIMNEDKPRYSSVFYKRPGKSKPLIIGVTSSNTGSDVRDNSSLTRINVYAEDLAYFDVVESQWPNMEVTYGADTNAIPWMSWKYPQTTFNTGFISVPVAQHSHSKTSVSSKHAECSRGYNNVTGLVGHYDDNISEFVPFGLTADAIKNSQYSAVELGLSFQQMFNTAYDRREQISGAIICGWNEWIAMKQGQNIEFPTTAHFVDVYNHEFSRDLEMMQGSYGDNFYMQLVENIRRIKYQLHEDGQGATITPATVDINSYDYGTAWNGVTAEYEDFIGDAMIREYKYGEQNTSKMYTDYTARNDIKIIKMAHDDNNLYVYVECVDDITAYNGTDRNWMNILIGTEYGGHTMAGYNYFINRTPSGNGTTSIEKYNNGSFSSVGTAKFRLDGNKISFEIPLSAIGGQASVRFKVCDNIQNQTDIMDYYVSGDSAPLGRLGYAYNW